MNAHTETRGQPHVLLFQSHLPHLFETESLTDWPKGLMIPVGWLFIEIRDPLIYLLSSAIRGIYRHTLTFTWMLGIKHWSFIASTLLTDLSSQPPTNCFVLWVFQDRLFV